MGIAEAVVLTAAAYAGVGLIAGLVIVTAALERIDPKARGASAGFRVLILPAMAALWPWMVVRAVRGRKG